MQFSLIKNAAAYTAMLPNAEAMAVHLAERPFVPVLETLISSAGFVPNLTTGELVTPIAGGYSFTVRIDEKMLPSSAVCAAVDAATAEFKEANDLESLDAEQRGQIRERIYMELVKRALTKSPTYCNCFYYEEDNLLIIPTSSKALAQSIMGMVIQCVGSVKTSTIWVAGVKGGLTARLKKYLGDPGIEDYGQIDAFGLFSVGDAIVMKNKSEKVAYDVKNLDGAKAGLREALNGEFEVENMKLVFNGVEMKLTHDFKLRSIRFIEELTEEEAGERYGDEADTAHMWRCEAGIQLMMMANVFRELCDMFEYKPLGDGEKITHSQQRVASEDMSDEIDSLYEIAKSYVVEERKVSISGVQRKLKIGYNRAARIVERLEQEGVVTAMNTNGSREVIQPQF